jgi:hypothetical protein
MKTARDDCGAIEVYGRFGGTYCGHHQDERVSGANRADLFFVFGPEGRHRSFFREVVEFAELQGVTVLHSHR